MDDIIASCKECDAIIWKVDDGLWSHYGDNEEGFTDHQAVPKEEIVNG